MKDEQFALNIKEEPSLSEILDKVLDTGVVVRGDLVISLADVDLVYVNLQLLITSVDKVYTPTSIQK